MPLKEMLSVFIRDKSEVSPALLATSLSTGKRALLSHKFVAGTLGGPLMSRAGNRELRLVSSTREPAECHQNQQLLILVTLGRLSCGGDEAELSVSCPGHQRASEGSCYEFVAQERSFSGAQACCEERGGHLAFVPNKDTQHFLQRHLDPEKDVWLGVALSASPNLQYSATVGGKRGEM